MYNNYQNFNWDDLFFIKFEVMVSSYEAIKDLFNREETLGRQCEGIWWDRSLKQNLGILFFTKMSKYKIIYLIKHNLI